MLSALYCLHWSFFTTMERIQNDCWRHCILSQGVPLSGMPRRHCVFVPTQRLVTCAHLEKGHTSNKILTKSGE